MNSISEIMCLCRLCLEKEDVNTPIFEEQGEIGQISLKISTCLPVKVSKEDDLPKNICGGCLCKLEMFYQFWNTCANADKKLVKWIDQISVNKISDKRESAASNVLIQHSIDSNPIVLKQEVMEIVDTQSDDLVSEHLNMSNDDQDYLLQQQSLTYEPVEFQFQQDEFETVAEDDSSNAGVQSHSQHKRVAAMRSLSHVESEDEDDPDSMNAHITKTEDDTDDSGEGDPKPTTFVGLPPDDNVQAGTSTAVQSIRDAPIKYLILSGPVEGIELRALHQCRICWKFFDNDDYLKKHEITHLDEKPYQCDVCSESFKNKNLLATHRRASHAELYQCDICEKKMKSIKQLEVHKNRHVKKFSNYCTICNKGFYNIYEEKAHALRHDENVEFKCPICGKRLLEMTYLKKHILTHDANYRTNKNFKCNSCEKSFLSKSALNLHLKSHSGENTCICHICGKLITSRQGLNDHVLLHDGVKRHKCEQCDKTFARSDYLKVHMRSHTGNKPYKCVICAKSFTQRATLVIHTRYHTGEKPYTCSLCNETFVCKSLLNIHKKSKHQLVINTVK